MALTISLPQQNLSGPVATVRTKAVELARVVPVHPQIICQMRIRNEERWLPDVLDSIARVAGGIVILDDGSQDRTPEICKAHPAVIDYLWQNESTMDEVRDKNRLLRRALACKPDWVLCMDGDEILEDSAPERIRDAIAHCPPDVSVFDIQFLYMWNDLSYYRTDGIYGRIYHHRLFRLQGQNLAELAFVPTRHGGNLHCESVPPTIRGRSMEIDVKVKHLGYMLAEDRERKLSWYRSKDPVHAAKGYYDHLVDQPGMVTVEWKERPYFAVQPKQTIYNHLHETRRIDQVFLGYPLRPIISRSINYILS